MSVVLVFLDADDRLDAPADVDVRDAASYLNARRAITHALETGGTLRVAVVGPRMKAWMQDVGPMQSVTTRAEGLRARLEGVWGQPLPSGLSVQEAREIGADGATAGSETSVESMLIGHALGAVWAVPDPGPAHLAELLLAAPAQPATPWLLDALGRRLDAWETGPLGGAYRALRASPVAFRQAVLARAAADVLGAPAPEALRAHRADAEIDGAALKQAVRAVAGSPLRDAAVAAGRHRLAPALLAYWIGEMAGQTETLADLAARLPGQSVQELIALVRTAEAPDRTLSDCRLHEADVRALRGTFGGLNGSAEPLERLATRVVPDPPPDPDPAWSDATRLEPWRDWLNAYLAYRAAVDRLGAPEEDLVALERQATSFSDWFTAKYSALLRDGRDLVTSVAGEVRAHLDRGERVLLVVWDNLPAHHAAPVIDCLATDGLFLSADVDWRLALLPSVTAVSFPALLAGRLVAPGEGVGDEKRTALIEAAFPGASVQFQNTLKYVERLATDPADLSVVHFTSYDALLHKSDHEFDDDRETALAQARSTIASRLAATLNAYPHDRPVRLVVTSDHGSTRLPVEVATAIPRPPGSNETLGVATEEEAYSSRAIRVPPLTRSSADVCTRLEADDTGLGGPVLLARGFRTWSTPRRGAGYVHGGALPEEALVPLIVMGRDAVHVEPLGLTVTNQERLGIGAPGVLHVSLRNPNGVSALDARLAAEVAGAERSSVVLDAPLPAGATCTAAVPFTPAAADVRDLHIAVELVLTATVLGQTVETRTRTMVPVQSALNTQADDDLFDF